MISNDAPNSALRDTDNDQSRIRDNVRHKRPRDVHGLLRHSRTSPTAPPAPPNK